MKNQSKSRLTAAFRVCALVLGLMGLFTRTGVAQGPPDNQDDVDAFRLDVFVVVGGHLQNPVGFCTAEPCPAGETSPSTPLFALVGIPLGVTWGEWQSASATSRVQCKNDGTMDVRVRLSGLIPNAVYSLFYRTFGPDSINPFCPNEERSLVVPGPCNGPNCPNPPNSTIVTDQNGQSSYVGTVNSCLLSASTVLLDVIYHLNGNTYGALPNQLESVTQLTPCQISTDCPAGDECSSNVCQPVNCAATNTCRVCHSSFGNDAMRQMVIIQKAP